MAKLFDELDDIACFDAKNDGDYNLWDDLRERERKG